MDKLINQYKQYIASQDDIDAINILVKEIVKAIKGNTVSCDRTFKSAVKEVNKKGYIILDETGNERTVRCALPGIDLKVGDHVWVEVPCGRLKDSYICGKIQMKNRHAQEQDKPPSSIYLQKKEPKCKENDVWIEEV